MKAAHHRIPDPQDFNPIPIPLVIAIAGIAILAALFCGGVFAR